MLIKHLFMYCEIGNDCSMTCRRKHLVKEKMRKGMYNSLSMPFM